MKHRPFKSCWFVRVSSFAVKLKLKNGYYLLWSFEYPSHVPPSLKQVFRNILVDGFYSQRLLVYHEWLHFYTIFLYQYFFLIFLLFFLAHYPLYHQCMVWIWSNRSKVCPASWPCKSSFHCERQIYKLWDRSFNFLTISCLYSMAAPNLNLVETNRQLQYCRCFIRIS